MKYLIALLLALTWSTPTLAQESFKGRVVGVHDGDTLTVLDADKKQHKIRMAEIDAPESRQDFGARSKQMLSDMVFNKEVEVHSFGKKLTLDRYGRLVGRIMIDGQSINRKMIENGGAWVYRQYLKDKSLIEVEQQARNGKKGLWGLSTKPVAPWEWRHPKKPKQADPKIIPTISTTTCGNKRYCKQMSSCAEATFYLKQCGISSLDGDKNGIPCESLCRAGSF